MRPVPERDLGDRDPAWRNSYLRGRKDPFVDAASSNRRRLDAMGVEAIVHGRWLDLGAGDGNLAAELMRRGADTVVALEYQFELLDGAWGGSGVLGDAAVLPLRTASVHAAVAMDVLHHLEQEQLDRCLGEVARVLVPGAPWFVCEPAPTVIRSVLQRVLMSPLSSLSRFSRDKRTMVELEAATLVPWLHHEPDLAARAAPHGLQLEHTARRPLHTMRRFRRHGRRA